MKLLNRVLTADEISNRIIDVPNFPKEGIIFKDITPILADPDAFQSCIRRLADLVTGDFNKIVAIESRGFLLGAALAEHFHTGLVLVRKPGKLPRPTASHTYTLEYGQDTLEIHKDDIKPGDNVIIVDDVLATGGTASAAEKLIGSLGAKVVSNLFLIELKFLNGTTKLNSNVHSLIQID